MKMRTKGTIATASAAILLSALLGQTSQAGVIESGTATLADVMGTSSGTEALTVNYSVSLSSGIYTYSYVVNDPLGDVLLNGSGGKTSTPEIVDAFSVGFNATIPGTFLAGTQSGGATEQDNGVGGLFWSFSAINPGGSSPTLSFESDFDPTFGNANAQDANPPSPWSSAPFGEPVPVPNVPDSTNTMPLLAGVLLLLPFLSARRVKAGLSR